MDDVVHYEVSCGKFLSFIPTLTELKGQDSNNYFDSYYESLDESLGCGDRNNSLHYYNSDYCSSLVNSGSVSLMFHQMSQLNEESSKLIPSASMNSHKVSNSFDGSIFNKLLIQNYTEYLIDASSVINELKVKCSSWANLYDSLFILETLNYSPPKNSLTNSKLNCKFLDDTTSPGKVKDGDDEELTFTINESASPPPTIDSPSSSSETTCTDSGVFVNLNTASIIHQNQCNNAQQQQQQQHQVSNDNLRNGKSLNNESSAQTKCANNEQPTQLTLANKVNIESSSVPLQLSSSSTSPQPLISNSSNCSTIILSPFTTTTRVFDKNKNGFLTVDTDDTGSSCTSNIGNSKTASIAETASVDETSSSISDVTLMINHRHSNNCSPVTSVEELHSMAHESCVYGSSGTGSTNGQIVCDSNDVMHDSSESIIGPFLLAILTKLESMVEADLVTNLQLTGIISHLCCYPLPLLRSFFLSSLVSGQTGVKTFRDSLEITRSRIINETSKLKQFDSTLCTCRCYLMSRDSDEKTICNSNYGNVVSCTSTLQLLNRYNINLNESISSTCSTESSKSSKSSNSGGSNRRKSLKEFLFRSKGNSKSSNISNTDVHGNIGDPFACQLHCSSINLTSNKEKGSKNIKQPKQPVLESLNTGTGYRYINRASYDSTSSKESDLSLSSSFKPFGSEKDQRVMLAALVFEEFMKEISAICHEHSISFAPSIRQPNFSIH